MSIYIYKYQSGKIGMSAKGFDFEPRVFSNSATVDKFEKAIYVTRWLLLN